jgi:hypothetical protein
MQPLWIILHKATTDYSEKQKESSLLQVFGGSFT